MAVFLSPVEAQQEEFSPTGYNSFSNGDETRIYGKYVNYYDTEWKKVDLTPKSNGSKFTVDSAPFGLEFPVRANGVFKFTDKHEYNPVKQSFINQDPISKTRIFTDAKNVRGIVNNIGIEYPDAIPNTDALVIELDTNATKYLLRWDETPEICSTQRTFNINFTQTPDAGLVARKRDNTRVSSTDESLHGFKFSAGERSIVTPQARIWDSYRKEEDVEIKGRQTDQFFGYKIIDCSFFDGAVFPVFSDDVDTFYPDPDAESTSVDGHVVSTSTVWATARGAVTGTAAFDSSTNLDIDNYLLGSNYGIYRGFTLFDTSAIPDTNVVTSATLSCYVLVLANDDNDGNDYVSVIPTSPASNTSIGTVDFDAVTFTKISNDIDISSMSTSAWNTWTLTDLSVVSLTGITKIGLMGGHDYANDPHGTGESWMRCASADTALTTSDPYLTVTHSVAASPPTPMRNRGSWYD